jgi:protein TonB
LLQPPSPVTPEPFTNRLRTPAGRRAVGIGAALAIEAVLLLLLLSLGRAERGGEDDGLTVVNLEASEASEAADETPESEASPSDPVQPRTEAEPPEPVPQVPVRPQPMPSPAAVLPVSRAQMERADIAPQPQARPRAQAPAQGPAYGPQDTGGPRGTDSERVGTMPNGEPLYAARWYREPTDGELRGYLSTASGPGWGLIACRTAPGYRVEDCVPLAEYPEGSMMNRAVLAAAWQFKVRPPRLGGRELVGEWVRIRIEYTISQR